MPKILIIDSCFKCEHRKRYATVVKWYCEKEDKELVNIHKIPSWCPLPDAEEKDGSK